MNKRTKIASRIVNLLGKFKIFVQRAMGYVALINTGMILLLVLQKYDFEFMHQKYFIVFVYLATFLILMIIGFIDDKIGMFRIESTLSADRNPYFKETVSRLKRIENILENNESKR